MLKKLLLTTICFVALSISAVNAVDYTLSWDASPPGDQVTKYVIYELQDDATWAVVGEVTTPSWDFSINDSEAHTYSVSAANLAGESARSTPATVPVLPNTPINLRITVKAQVVIDNP